MALWGDSGLSDSVEKDEVPYCISVSVLFFNGVTSVALLSVSIMAMMCLYPHWEWKGYCPVWYKYVLYLA